MANVTGASLQPIYERLHNAPSYHPLEANTFADPSLEAGDVVTVVRNGVNYSSPVHTSKITWKKATQVQIAAGGNEERPSIQKMSGKKYGGGRSGLRNSEYLHYYVEDQYQQMKSGLELTTSTALLYVDNKYTQMQSGLLLTASTAKLYVDDKYNQMQSGLALSTSTAKLYVDDKYSQMQSGLALTTSTAKLYVDNKYTQMQSGLALSTSTAKLYVDNKYTQMQSGLALSTSTAKLYVENRTTRAYIMTRINADGEGEALIEASKVKITGTTTLSGSLEIDNGDLIVKKSAVFRGNINLSTAGAYVQAPIFSVTSGGRVRLIGTQSGEYYDITATNIKGVIKDAKVENNVLTLTKWDGNTVTFSKATTQTPSWSGSTLTVTAKQVNGTTTTNVASTTIGFGGSYGDHNVELIVDANGYPTRYSATHIEVPVYVGSLNGGSTQPTSRYTKNLRYSISTLLQESTATANGDVTPDTSHIGLSKVTVNVNPTLAGTWSSSVLTVGTTPGTNKYTVGLGGSYGAHSVDLIVAQNGNPTRYSATQINVPVYIGSQNGGGANPTSRYTTTLRYTISSLLQTKSVTSNGDVTPDSSYIGLSKVTVNVTSNPTLSGSWSGSVLTVTPSVGSNTFKVGFGSYGAHDADLVVAQNGSATRYSSTQISVPVYVGSQNGGGANPTSRYTTTLRYTISDLLEEITLTVHDGIYTPSSGKIGFSKVTLNVPGGGEGGIYRMAFQASNPISSRFYVYAYAVNGESDYETVYLTLGDGKFAARSGSNTGTIYGEVAMPSLGNVYASTSSLSAYDALVTIASSTQRIYFTIGGKTYNVGIRHS